MLLLFLDDRIKISMYELAIEPLPICHHLKQHSVFDNKNKTHI